METDTFASASTTASIPIYWVVAFYRAIKYPTLQHSESGFALLLVLHLRRGEKAVIRLPIMTEVSLLQQAQDFLERSSASGSELADFTDKLVVAAIVRYLEELWSGDIAVSLNN